MASVTATIAKPNRDIIRRLAVRNEMWRRIQYKPHAKQLAVHDALARGCRFFHIPAGTRSGKTRMLASEMLVEMAFKPPPGETHRKLQISAPETDLTDKVFRYLWHWIIVENVFSCGARVASERERYIEMPWGSRVDGRTSKEPSSLQGDGLVCAACDEDAEAKSGVWNQYIRRALADYRGWSMRIGVPRGRNYWYQDYLAWTAEMEAGNPDYFTTVFTSYDNPYLPDGEIAQIEAESKKQGWHDIFRQEYLAEFTSLAGLVYPGFRPEFIGAPWHVAPVEYLSGVSIVLGIDWGFRNPFVCLIAQVRGDKLIILDEIYTTGRTDQECAELVNQRLYDIDPYFEIEQGYGDPSSPEGIQTFIQNGIPMYSPSGGGRSRLNNVNDGIMQVRQLLGVEDVPMLQIHPKCVNLIREMQSYQFSEKAVDEKPVKTDDHACDALRYLAVGAISKGVTMPAWI